MRYSVWSATASFLLSCASARLVNITIDNTLGDPLANRNITYLPSGTWHTVQYPGYAEGPTRLSSKNTLTESTFDPVTDANITKVASILFNGTAVYVECVVGDTHSLWTSDMTFFVDNALAGTFLRSSRGLPVRNDNTVVFSLVNLSMGEHNITIQNGHANGTKSTMRLYSIIYTRDNGAIPVSRTIVTATVLAIIGTTLIATLAFLLRRHRRRLSAKNIVADNNARSSSPLPETPAQKPGHLQSDSRFLLPVLAARANTETPTHSSPSTPNDPPVEAPSLSSGQAYNASTTGVRPHCARFVNDTISPSVHPLPSFSNATPNESESLCVAREVASTSSLDCRIDVLSPLSTTSTISIPPYINIARAVCEAELCPHAVPTSLRIVAPSLESASEVISCPIDNPRLAVAYKATARKESELRIFSPEGCDIMEGPEGCRGPVDANNLDVEESHARNISPSEDASVLISNGPHVAFDSTPAFQTLERPSAEIAPSNLFLEALSTANTEIPIAMIEPPPTLLVEATSEAPAPVLPLSGIVYWAGLSLQTLPLTKARIHASILDTSAQVSVTQMYLNPTQHDIHQTSYVFRVPPEAHVCEFSARKSSGENFVGNITPEEIINEAVSECDHMLKIPACSIMSGETVETKVTYVVSLLSDDNADEIQFILPRHAVGLPSSPLHVGNSPVYEGPKVSINIDIQTTGELHSIVSPSHKDGLMEEVIVTSSSGSHRASRVSYTSDHLLETDLVVLIYAEGLDAPRCFAEVASPTANSTSQTIAFHLSMVPKFSIPAIPSQQYLFVIDRSFSMTGLRMETAKATLAVLLKLLPVHGTKFNIISFGSSVRRYCDISLPYDEISVNNAVAHVLSMQANLPGTDIRLALLNAFHFCDGRMPTVVFLLTDGETQGNPNDVVADVWSAVQAAPPSAPLRVFTLGIGATVCRDLCEAIATVGNGECLFASDAGSIMGRCARLLQAGRHQYVRNVVVDWGHPQSQQSIHDLHAGTRISVHAILPLGGGKHLPQRVGVSGQLSESRESFHMDLPVHFSQLPCNGSNMLQIHRLAAWRLRGSYQPLTSHRPIDHDNSVTSLPPQVFALINCQRFDGAFPSSTQLGMILGSNIFYDHRRQGADPVAWATALAIAYLQKYAPGHKELWVKPSDFMKDLGGQENTMSRAAQIFL